MSVTIAIDAMGGDVGPAVTVPASLSMLRQHPQLQLRLVGQQDVLNAVLARQDAYPRDRLTVVHASETVGMDESPAKALRNKKDSSMRVAINLVRDGEAQACVSAGNTGALMATARFVLKTPAGIDRPAIVTTWPSINGHIHVLDLGANVDCSPELLLQFAIMGSILVRAVENKAEPKVALLNIGIEDIKGNTTIKKAAELMRNSAINYCGYVEGNEIYTGDMDVIVAQDQRRIGADDQPPHPRGVPAQPFHPPGRAGGASGTQCLPQSRGPSPVQRRVPGRVARYRHQEPRRRRRAGIRIRHPRGADRGA